RDFNWHNTIGFWCAIPIAIMTVSGAVISYSWASNLVYRLTGSPVPSARGSGPGGPPVESRASQGRGGEQAAGLGRAERTPNGGGAAEGRPRPPDERVGTSREGGPRGPE